ncbi:MAG: CvpA family protein [Verrucomicrobiales bacterium]|nr:CvpA family protein [Verrucomicrobiales bacterium]
MTPGTIDILATSILLFGARSGCRVGFGEILWPTAGWVAVALIGPALAGPLTATFIQVGHFSNALAACLAYTIAAIGIAIAIHRLRVAFGERLLSVLPCGHVDKGLGLVAGLIGTAATLLAVLAVLHPWQVANVDWNPRDMNGDEAIFGLFLAVVGTLRRLVIDESWIGHTAVAHLAAFLLPP